VSPPIVTYRGKEREAREDRGNKLFAENLQFTEHKGTEKRRSRKERRAKVRAGVAADVADIKNDSRRT